MSEQAMKAPAAAEPWEVVVHGSAKGFAQEVAVGGHRITADEPAAVGGTDTGPGPYDLLLAALGSCTSMTVGLYARRKQWPLEAVRVRLRHAKIHAADCEDCETKVGMLDRLAHQAQGARLRGVASRRVAESQAGRPRSARRRAHSCRGI